MDRTFIIDEESGVLLSQVTGEVLPDYKEPPKLVPEVAHIALDQGAILVDKWDFDWGTAAALSVPGSTAAWFLVDDYESGRFESIGVRFLRDIAFGYPVAIYHGDTAQAARFALSYGIRRDKQLIVESVLDKPLQFPTKNKKVTRLWGATDVLEYETLTYGLQYLQKIKGIGPVTVLAASKTIEVFDE